MEKDAGKKYLFVCFVVVVVFCFVLFYFDLLWTEILVEPSSQAQGKTNMDSF